MRRKKRIFSRVRSPSSLPSPSSSSSSCGQCGVTNGRGADDDDVREWTSPPLPSHQTAFAFITAAACVWCKCPRGGQECGSCDGLAQSNVRKCPHSNPSVPSKSQCCLASLSWDFIFLYLLDALCCERARKSRKRICVNELQGKGNGVFSVDLANLEHETCKVQRENQWK